MDMVNSFASSHWKNILVSFYIGAAGAYTAKTIQCARDLYALKREYYDRCRQIEDDYGVRACRLNNDVQRYHTAKILVKSALYGVIFPRWIRDVEKERERIIYHTIWLDFWYKIGYPDETDEELTIKREHSRYIAGTYIYGNRDSLYDWW